MVYNLRIGKYETKIYPLMFRAPKLEDTDKEGNKVFKDYSSKSKFVWKSEKDGKVVTKTYKSYNGKVFRKLVKTTEVKEQQIKKVTKEKALDLNSEKHYLVVCEKLKKELNENEALTFLYSNGNGFKIYQTVVYKNGNDLVMSCGLGWKSELINNIDIKTGDVETEEDDIDRATTEDMMKVIGIEQ